MKIRSFLTSGVLIMVLYTNCSKDKKDTVALNDMESKLMGTWLTMTITVEQTGKPPVVQHVNAAPCYFIVFKNEPYPIRSDGIYADTKWADDQKDCAKYLHAWKVGSDGRLLLASSDTLYADILIVGKDTLAFRTTNSYTPDEHIVYEFR
ncbi:hypothetical protein [Chitinophaga ginsengisoli]|uniref:Lipocalin-like protein n=1 Tax=Chitinophaga ginsengisoli TaxID=363837 RepID=A0A2P8GH96_9BACT|nr:hypothetical protein [Chitinophaga ginsengisoli]PSL33341.1 hypothetical protein CLV42_103324 [Chitinophaga ginsengisoli]